MKVLTIINSFHIGGIEKVLLQCLPLFQKLGIQMDVCCFEKSGPLLKNYEKYIKNIYKIKKTGNILFDAYQLNRILKKNKYDIVHSRFGFNSGGFCFICYLMKIPIIVSLHSMKASAFSKKRNFIIFTLIHAYTFINKKLTKIFASHIVGHSKSNLTNYDKRWQNKKKYSLIYNGVDFENIKIEVDSFNFDKNYFYILHVGSFRPSKNHKLLINIFDNIKKKRPNSKLVLLGDGILRAEISEILLMKGLEKDVYFQGTKDNIGYYYKNSDLFIFPSIHEGLGNVIIEAQYFELPIMASNISPHLEALSMSQHDHLFDLNIPSEMIARLAIDIMENEKEYLSESKQYVIDNFSINNMVQEIYNLYKTLS